MGYEELVRTASLQLTKARLIHGSAVGVAIQLKDGTVVTGFNIENRVQKGYHAEEVALITALKLGYQPNDFDAIAIVYSGDSDVFYPGCAVCRQMLWEYTNPNLNVIAFNVKLNKGATYKLSDLYPMPYPVAKTVENIKVPDKSEDMSKTCVNKKGKEVKI